MDKFSKYCNVISGYAFASSDLQEAGDIPIIKIGNIGNGGNIRSDCLQYVNSSFLTIDKKYHLNNKDILISLTGSHLNQPNSVVGRSCRLYSTQTYLLNQRAGKVIPKDNVDKDFLYYILSSNEIKYSIAIRAYGGANQVNVSPSDIENIKWEFPEYDTQCKIGKILSAYDDLIENNNKRIELLENMAQELYKEWFVRFRFPGHKTAKFKNGIPEGWEYTRLESLAYISTGKCNREDAEEDGMFPLFDRSQEVKKSNSWLKDCEAIIIPGEGTSFIPRYYKGKFNLHQRCYCIEPKLDNIGFYLFQTLMMQRIYFLYVATGATVPSLRLNNFNNFKVLMPREDLYTKYNNYSITWFKEIDILKSQNENLKAQRDLLLPRLMSGKLEV